MEFIAIIGGLFLLVAVFSIFSGYRLIRGKEWTPQKKKIVFSLTVALLMFPALAPAGTISAIPLPNIVVFIFSLSELNPLALLMWYAKTWFFTIPSYVLTALLCRGIAAIMFFSYPRKEELHK